MKIRRFYSKNMRGALRQVADVFGADAAILSNKRVPGGVEVIAALDYDESLLRTSTEPDGTDSAEQAVVSHAESEFASQLSQHTSVSHRSSSNDPQDIARERIGELDSRVEDSKATIAHDSEYLATHKLSAKHSPDSEDAITGQIGGSKSHLANDFSERKSSIEWGADPSLLAMKEELGLMRSMIADQLKGIGWSRFIEQNPLQAMFIRRLTALGIEPGLHGRLLQDLAPAEDAECSWQALLARMAKQLPVCQSDLLQKGGIYALMGPAGVGKTTTIAKLAARHIIKHGADSVGLITTDSYRVSAQEQLSMFGRLLKVPVVRVDKTHSLSQRIQQFKEKRLVLVDTAGMSSKDRELSKPLQDICNSDTKITPILLLSAASQLASMQRVLDLFMPYRPKAMIFTKLDEAASLGECLSVLLNNSLPVMYSCDGQKIPEDIRVARAHHLVAKAVWLSNKFGHVVDDWQLAQATSGADSLARSA